MQAHPDRPSSSWPWIGQRYTFESIQATRCFDDDGFHDDLQFTRVGAERRFYYSYLSMSLSGFTHRRPLGERLLSARKAIIFSPTSLTGANAMDLHLRGKSVLITGASKGIGAATAEAFAEEGGNVHLAARSTDAMQALAERLRAAYQVNVIAHTVELRDAMSRHRSSRSSLQECRRHY
jgi:hypothetical protein